MSWLAPRQPMPISGLASPYAASPHIAKFSENSLSRRVPSSKNDVVLSNGIARGFRHGVLSHPGPVSLLWMARIRSYIIVVSVYTDNTDTTRSRS